MIEQRYCSICNKLFQPTHHNQKRCSGPHYRECPICKKQMPWTEYERCCSKACTQAQRKSTCLEKYGTEFAQQSETVKAKSVQTCLTNFGVQYPAQNADVRKKQLASFDSHFGKDANPEGFAELQLKRKNTCRARYNVDWSFQSDINKEKSKVTLLQKYGVLNAMQSPEVKKKFEENVLAKYGVRNVMQSEQVKGQLRQKLIAKYGVKSTFQIGAVREQIVQTNLDRYGVPWYCMTDHCKEASGKIISKVNIAFGEMLQSFGIDYQMEYRIGSYSFDFKVGNILIEIDPTFTHTSLFNPFDRNSSGLDAEYHKRKSRAAQSEGFSCLHVFDWDSWDKIIQLIKPPSRKLNARECQVTVVDDASSFLDVHHIQGACRGVKVALGLFYHDELVEVMTFGSPRYNNHYQWELLRLCSLPDVSVRGGPSKLIKYFIDNYHPESILSYCDSAKFSGQVYSQIGFSLASDGEPSKIWSKGSKHITDNLLRQRGYDQLFGTSYGKGTSNEELMINNGWLPVYDCGQKVFTWRI